MYDKACKKCGTRLSEFYATGMLGCPECYNAFKPEIESSLLNIQGATVHKGKAPECKGLDRELMAEYERLLSEREKAGLEGRFSDMAEISEDLFELSEELKKRGLL